MKETKLKKETLKIRELNDLFRNTNFNPTLGKLNLSEAVELLPNNDKEALLGLVMEFGNFTEDNDPYGEHDFGSIGLRGKKYFFKIDYYDKNLEYHSRDPSDPTKTIRVLTIMRADEY